jgi:hypothetical protein
VNFYELGPRQDYAGYYPEELAGEMPDARVPPGYRQVERIVAEYLGDPPRKPGKKGDFHKSAVSFFARGATLAFLETACRGLWATEPATLKEREGDGFRQFWVLNFVDCLDVAASRIGDKLHKDPERVGVIKRAVIDEARWDGSDLFVLPQNPNHTLYCSERFVEGWKAAKLKGALFSRHLMDPEAIKI